MLDNVRRTAALLPALLALGCMPMSARQLAPQEALDAMRNSTFRAPARVADAPVLRSTFTAPGTGLRTLYVFTPASGEGFMVLAADDVATPVLAYSETGRFDEAEMAPAAKAWLENYSAQIARAATNGGRVEAAPAKAGRADITPLVKTKWDQDAPYNDKAPLSGSTRCVTGCVATAISQVMKVHQWPDRGVGTESYTWGSSTLSFNYGNTTFDWSNMLDTYPDSGSAATATQRNAVATLMYAAGVAAHMDYGTDNSGANTATMLPNLISHLRYDKSMIFAPRDYYLLSEWADMLYTDIAAGRPIYYRGSTVNDEGHAFVLDGYRSADGFFHFNWGWGGLSDGYYSVTELCPDSQGIGGGSAGFILSQHAILGLKPAVSGSTYTPLFLAEAFTTEQTQYSRTGTVTFNFDGGVYNYSLATMDTEIGVKLVNNATGATSYVWSNYGETELDIYYGYNTLPFSASNFPASGTYTVTPVVRVNSEIEPVHVEASANRELTLTCSANTLRFATVGSGAEIEVVSVDQPSTYYPGYSATLNVTVKNTGDADYINLPLLCAFQYGSKMFQFPNLVGSVGIDQTTTYTFTGTLPDDVPAGKYSVIFVYLDNDQTQHRADTHGATVTVATVPTGEVAMSLTSMEFPDFTDGRGTATRPWIIPVDPARFTITVECTSGLFDGIVGTYVLNGNTQVDVVYYDQFYTLAAGDSKTIKYAEDWTELLEDDVKYTLRPFYGVLEGNTIDVTPFSKAYYIKKDNPAGIVEAAKPDIALWPNPASDIAFVEADGLSHVEVYSASGSMVLSQPCAGNQATLDVAALPAGIYIVKAAASDGIHTLKMIKNQ